MIGEMEVKWMYLPTAPPPVTNLYTTGIYHLVKFLVETVKKVDEDQHTACCTQSVLARRSDHILHLESNFF